MQTAAASSTRPAAGLTGGVLAAVIVVWGLGPPISKLIDAPAVIAVLYRFWLSVPLLLLTTRALGRPARWAAMRRAAVAGAAFGVNLVFVFLTFDHAAIAVLSVAITLQPGVILLLAGRVLGERPGLWHVAWTVVGIGGAAVVILGAGSDVDTDVLGVVYAAASMLTFTVYFVITRLERSRPDDDTDPVEWMAGVSLFAALVVTPWALVASDGDDFLAVDGVDWLWLGFITIFTGILGHVGMAWLQRYIQASRSSLYMLSMNVVAVGGAWIIHDEPLTWVQGLGGVVVLGAVAAVVSRPAARIP